MSFKTKSIEVTSLGEKLRRAREVSKVSLEAFALETRIQKKYLEALESGDAPGLVPTYLRGMLQHYATAFGLDREELYRLWEREQPMRNLADRFPGSPIKPPTVLLTPARLKAAVILLGLIFFLWFFFLR
ncbi:helix-turn-helix domain-containing protein [Candidatus Azambacteria bacterium]|nr:helix-turn-helix domain-containing protein [Candidatus Azambacteria bacterium]